MSYLLGPQRIAEAGRKCLVLDLDETLVHSSFKPVENPDITLKVDIEGQLCVIYVLVRPFVSQFLKRMAKIYELVIFTASLSKYAEPLVAELDPDNFCSYKLFREHCTFYNNAFVKDLTRLGRPMNEVIILDNSPVAYLFQPENAMPAVSWYEDPTDEELLRVATLLEHMAYEEDVRKVIRTLIVQNKIEPR
jgi:RNA polymerase II subunit A small phosphatase-like protein